MTARHHFCLSLHLMCQAQGLTDLESATRGFHHTSKEAFQ